MNMLDAVVALGEQAGLSSLALDENGRVAFDANGGARVELQGSADHSILNVIMAVGTLGAGDARSLLLELLQSNATRVGLCTPCFAVSANTGEVLMRVSIPIGQVTKDAVCGAFARLLESVSAAKSHFSGTQLHTH